MPKRNVAGVLTGPQLLAELAETSMWGGNGAAGDATEVVAPVTQSAPDFAWSDDDQHEAPSTQDDDNAWLTGWLRLHPSPERRSWVGVCCAAIVGLSVCALIAVLIVKGWPSRDGGSPAPAANSAASASPRPSVISVASPPATASAPSVSPAPSASFARLVGDWQGHHHWMTVYPDGVLELHVQDYPASNEHCADPPPVSVGCSEAGTPKAVVHITLTAAPDPGPYGHYYALGVVKDSSDSREVPVGAHVRVDVESATDYHARVYPSYPASGLQGRIATLSFDGQEFRQNPYCDSAAGGCG